MGAPVKVRTPAPDFDDFDITPEMVAWFRENCGGASRRVMFGQTRRFLKFHKTFNTLSADWAAVWRRWMLDRHRSPSSRTED